ncbi:MAG: SDR family oxidoreductase [Thermomicrobiales bacterium]|nr:SDR family oxidoreductase [Thermomicrobiales bacterium]
MINELHIDQTLANPDVDLTDQVVLITGASRGVGAAAADFAAVAGADVVINYRSKERRAQAVADSVRAHGRTATLVKADLTNAEEVAAMVADIEMAHGRLDVLILNASGGLEKDVPEDYSMILNRDAQVGLVKAALPLMHAGSVLVFVTSHLAHYYGEKPVMESYETVAAGKKAGEESLRAMMPDLAARGIRFAIVSGDLIDGTITPKLLDRMTPGVIDQRREEAGWLPTTEDFAASIVLAAGRNDLEHGAVVYVGSTEW